MITFAICHCPGIASPWFVLQFEERNSCSREDGQKEIPCSREDGQKEIYSQWNSLDSFNCLCLARCPQTQSSANTQSVIAHSFLQALLTWEPLFYSSACQTDDWWHIQRCCHSQRCYHALRTQFFTLRRSGWVFLSLVHSKYFRYFTNCYYFCSSLFDYPLLRDNLPWPPSWKSSFHYPTRPSAERLISILSPTSYS